MKLTKKNIMLESLKRNLSQEKGTLKLMSSDCCTRSYHTQYVAILETMIKEYEK